MARLLIFVALLFIARQWWLSRQRLGQRAKPEDAPPGPPPTHPAGRPTATDAPVAMLACAHCDLRVPATEVLSDEAGRPYCCAEHRQAGPAPDRRP